MKNKWRLLRQSTTVTCEFRFSPSHRVFIDEIDKFTVYNSHIFTTLKWCRLCLLEEWGGLGMLRECFIHNDVRWQWSGEIQFTWICMWDENYSTDDGVKLIFFFKFISCFMVEWMLSIKSFCGISKWESALNLIIREMKFI